MKIKVGSFNIWNCRYSRKGSLSLSRVFTEVVKRECFDVVGVQELTLNYCDNLKRLLSDYKFFGSYRFGNVILKRLPFNENNNVITNKKVLFQKTYLMPFLPINLKELKQSVDVKRWSLLPRIATVVVLDVFNKSICVINTHLDYKIASIKKRQLDFLVKLVNEYSKVYPVVLMGDFNLSIKDDIFNSFILELNELGMKRISIDDGTWNCRGQNKKTLDHMFVPDDWSILSCGVIDDEKMDSISDHRMIFAECEFK